MVRQWLDIRENIPCLWTPGDALHRSSTLKLEIFAESRLGAPRLRLIDTFYSYPNNGAGSILILDFCRIYKKKQKERWSKYISNVWTRMTWRTMTEIESICAHPARPP